MVYALRGLGSAVVSILLLGAPARAQSNQVWPEVGAFVRLTDQMRF